MVRKLIVSEVHSDMEPTGGTMKKFLAALALVSMTMVAFTGAASAQATGEMVLTPPGVAEAGEATFGVEVSGFTGGIALFVLPCEFPDSGDMAEFDAGTCDTANLTPMQVGDDGTGEAEVTFDVPEKGLVIIAGDAARTESAVGVVVVGDAAGAEASAAGDSGSDDLAETGVETGMLAVVAGTLVAGGAMVVAASRRFS